MPGRSPVPFFIALSMLATGIFAALAFFIDNLKVGFISGFPPNALAATVISLDKRVKITPLLASAAPFFRFMVDHLL